MRFALPLMGVFGAGFLAGYSFFRHESPPPVAPKIQQPEIAEVPRDSRTGAERIAASLALGKDDPLRARVELWNAISALTADDVREISRGFSAFARIAKELNSVVYPDGADALRALLARWIEHDPSGAFAFLDTVSLPELDSTVRYVILQNCARRDPVALLARAVQEKDPSMQKSCASFVFRELAKNNPVLGRELLASVPDSLRSVAERAFEEGRIEADPFYGLAAAAKLTAGKRDDILSQTLPLLARMDAAAVEQAIRQFPEFSGAILGAFANRNSSAAASLFFSVDPSRAEASTVHSIAWDLANRDPKLALDWLEKVPPELVESTRDMVTRVSSSGDARAAMDWFVANPNPKSKQSEEVRNVFDFFLQSDEQGARAWLAKQTPEFAAKLEDKILGVLNDTGRTEDAARRIASNPPSDTRQIGWTGTLMARRDPHAAAAWALSLPDETAIDHAATSVAREWLDRDPGAAIAWVSTFPEGILLTDGARDIAAAIRRTRPAEAAVWVEKIPPSQKRTDSARMVFEAWKNLDSAAAHAWFSAVPGISEYTRAETLSR